RLPRSHVHRRSPAYPCRAGNRRARALLSLPPEGRWHSLGVKPNRDPNATVLRLVRTPASADRAPAPALDDSELLAAVRRGDSSAARALYDRCRPLVDRTIARLLGRNDPDRADVAQLASIEIVRSLAHYRGECSLDAWIARITARAVYRTIRARRSERSNV